MSTSLMLIYSFTEETPLDRELQSKEVARIMSETYPQPFIFLGYVVTKPHTPRRKPLIRFDHSKASRSFFSRSIRNSRYRRSYA